MEGFNRRKHLLRTYCHLLVLSETDYQSIMFFVLCFTAQYSFVYDLTILPILLMFKVIVEIHLTKIWPRCKQLLFRHSASSLRTYFTFFHNHSNVFKDQVTVLKWIFFLNSSAQVRMNGSFSEEEILVLLQHLFETQALWCKKYKLKNISFFGKSKISFLTLQNYRPGMRLNMHSKFVLRRSIKVIPLFF